MEVGEVVPDLGDLVALGEDTKRHAERHDDEADTEHGVDLTDDLVDGQERCDEVVDQDQNQPEELAGKDAGAAALGAQQLDKAGGPTANTVPPITSSTTLNTRMTFFIAPPR